MSVELALWIFVITNVIGLISGMITIFGNQRTLRDNIRGLRDTLDMCRKGNDLYEKENRQLRGENKVLSHNSEKRIDGFMLTGLGLTALTEENAKEYFNGRPKHK